MPKPNTIPNWHQLDSATPSLGQRCAVLYWDKAGGMQDICPSTWDGTEFVDRPRGLVADGRRSVAS